MVEGLKMTKTKFNIRKIKRRTERKNKVRKIGFMLTLSMTLITVLSISVFAFGNRKSGRMEYVKVADTGIAVSLDGMREFDIPVSYSDGDILLVIHRMDGTDDIYSKNYYVRSGDTLWDIASMLSENEFDVRDYIHEMKKLNDIDDGDIMSNTIIELPVI